MLILIRTSYENGQAYGDRTGQVFGTSYEVVSYFFDTDARAVTQQPGGQYDNFQDSNPPEPFDFDGEFYAVCDGTTRRGYVYLLPGDFTVTEELDSLSCGFVPPTPLTCDVGAASVSQLATPAGATLTASVSGTVHGRLRYRLNTGPEQPSPVFYGVLPGSYQVNLRDDGLPGCTRTVRVVVAPPLPPPPPAGAPQGLDFVGQPLWYRPAPAPTGAEVQLELWAESAHGREDFTLLLTLRKRVDAQGRLRFRLDTLLSPLLRPTVPASLATSQRCTSNLVNYFVRTTTQVPGRPPAYATGPLRTALLGGLPAEHRDVDYFAYRLDQGQPPFLSWAPAGRLLTAEQPQWLFGLFAGALLTVRRSYVRTGFAGGAPLVEEEMVDLRAGLASSRAGMVQLLALPVRPRAGMDAVSLAVYDEQGEALSPLVSFALVPATPRSRYLVFANSLGGLDTLRTEGQLAALLEATSEEVELPAAPDGAAPGAQRQAFGVNASRKLKLATGWLTAAELRWLQELVLARDIWEWRAGRLLPLSWPKRQLAYEADDNPLRGLLLEFDYAFAPTAYADLP